MLDERNATFDKLVDQFSKWRERAVGAVMLISIVAASIGGAFATFGRKIWAVIAG